MLRDQGPRQSVGYGVAPLQTGEQRGAGGESVISRFLGKSPMVKYLGAAAASLISMAAAGAIVRRGGMEAALAIEKHALASPNLRGKFQEGVKSFRKIESYLDEIQGVTRAYEQDASGIPDPQRLFKRQGHRVVRSDYVEETDGFHFRASNPNVDPWTIRQEIQQRMVRQARRLPYELPGFYIAQKALLDPIMGTNQDKKKVNWANPVDVLGDFAAESMKNIAFNVLPFEGAMGAGTGKYRQLMMKAAENPINSTGIASARYLLSQVGASSTDLLNRTLRFSNQSIGAFSQMVDDSIKEGKTFPQMIKSISTGSIFPNKPVPNANAPRRFWDNFKAAAKEPDLRKTMIDSMPGPFKGLGSGIGNFRKNFKNIGDTFDDWQDLISGRKHISALAPERARDVIAFMEKGGGTYMERFARDASNLNRFSVTKDGKINPQFRGSNFYKERSRQEFESLFIDSLSAKTGLTPEEAQKFVRSSAKISIADRHSGVKAGYNLANRIQFGTKEFSGTSQEWWEDIVQQANAHKIPLGKGQDLVTSYKAFEDAVKTADIRFQNPMFKQYLDRTIGKQWDESLNIVSQQASKSISWIKRPFEDFASGNLNNQREYLVKQTAQRLGIDVLSSGQPLPMQAIENSIRERGLEPTDLYSLRGYLMKKKDIAMPWQVGGRNIFGFKPLSVGQALDQGFYSARSPGEQELIKRFAADKAGTAIAGGSVHDLSWRMKAGGAYTDAAGNVIDLGRIRRGFTNLVDTISNETQIPILKFNPLQIFGRKAFSAQYNAPTIQMLSPHSLQPFLKSAPEAAENLGDDFLLAVRDQANKTTSRVFGISGSSAGEVTSHAYEGLYRPFLTNADTMVGHIARVMVGDMGVPTSSTRLDAPPSGTGRFDALTKRKGFLRDLFDVSYDQENSVFLGRQSLIRRTIAARRAGDEGFANPNILAEALGRREVDPTKFTSQMSEGMTALLNMLSTHGFSANTLRNISDPTLAPEFAHAFDPTGPLFGIEESALPRVARQILEDDTASFRTLNDRNQQQVAARARSTINNLLSQGERQQNYWDLPVTDSAQAIGVNRRIDQLRNELGGYLLQTADARTTLLAQQGQTAVQGTNDIIGSLFSRIEQLKVAGKISAREQTEARAAVLSLQLEGMRSEAFGEVAQTMGGMGVGFTQQDINTELAKRIQDSLNSETFDALGDIGTFRTGHPGVKGAITAKFRQATSAVPYEKPYDVNPFGAPYLMVPTFGTVAEQGGIVKAMQGALVNWSDPETANGMTAITSHMALRLNRYVETFGAGLDPTRYRGPLDFYARGLIGRRVLPAVAAGSTYMAIDRTIGGTVHKDAQGNPIYAPFFLGKAADVVAQGQIAAAGIVPYGQTAQQKEEELKSGEVPIRQGRYWFLSNQPWKGGRIQYFRPSWYQRFKAGAAYTPEMHETPMERLAFGYDFSPLKPLDPYRREREDAQTRPYPVSGDYFTGPWGALNPILNATVGRVLKPRRELNAGMTQASLAQYAPVGQAGAYYAGAANTVGFAGAGPGNPSTLATGGNISAINQGYTQGGTGTSASAFYPAMGYSPQRGTASSIVRTRATEISQMYSAQAQSPGQFVTIGQSLRPYGVPVAQGYMPPRVIPAGQPLQPSSLNVQGRDLGYRVQETLGIYGFAAANVRSSLGLGSPDFTPNRAVLEPSSRGYSSSRAFWNLNIGGLGDMPIPGDSRYSNFEISEIIRRFVPKDPQGITYVNDLPNLMGQQYPWLPGNEYPLNSVATGDPYSFPDAEIRLPGTGYARTHQVFGGQNGIATIHDILGDVAPWSQQYRQINAMADSQELSPYEQAKINQTRYQVEAMRIKKEFTPYEYENESIMETVRNPARSLPGRAWEYLQHRDTFFNSKFMPVRTATEDWERDNVYGATFPSWTNPIESYLTPFVNKSTQRGALGAALVGAGVGRLFGSTPRAKALGTVVGGATGAAASLFGHAYEMFTGERYIPQERRKEIALENYMDILKFTRANVNANRAEQVGDTAAADQARAEAQQTMYGVDLNSTPEQLAMAVPERKRDHFRALLYAPESEHKRILSTAGRLERRLYQAAWGMKVEARPNLQEYFQERELPNPESEIWNPSTDLENVKIKVGQSMGLDMAQMGYYPQQIQEANLVNPAYPDIFQSQSRRSTSSRIRDLLRARSAHGDVRMIPNIFGQDRVQLTAGVY